MRPDRRAFLALGTGAFLVATFPWARGRRVLVRRRFPMMGTVAEFAVVADPRGLHRRAAHRAIDAAFEELARVDAGMSRFRPDSDIGRLNRAGHTNVAADTKAVLAESLRWARATDGAFDPCVGRATELWDVLHREAPPSTAQATRFAGRELFRALEIDGSRVRLHDPDAAVDLGGIAKGCGVDLAVSALRRRGVTDGLVNVGGDLFAIGRSEDEDPWRIGIRGSEKTVLVEDAAMATSGDYERFFEHNGRHYHHLLDPHTGAPHHARRHSLTVQAPSCMGADVAATALFGMDGAKAAGTLAMLDPGARVVA